MVLRPKIYISPFFDALAPSPNSLLGRRKRKKQIIYVGKGSRAYAIVGNVIPGGLIGWMLGLRTGYGGSLRDFGWDIGGSGSSSETGWEKVS